MSPSTARAPLLLVLVWAAGVVLATAVGLLAVRVVAAQVGDPVAPALSQIARQTPAGSDQAPTAPDRSPGASAATSVGSPQTPTPTRPAPSGAGRPDAALAPPGSAGTTGRPAAAPPPPRAPQPARPATIASTFRSAGGTVGMQCTGTAARLLYVTPANGYALDETSVVGPQVEVRFQTERTRLRMQLSCASGTPRLLDVRTEEQPSREGTGGGSGSGKD